MNRQISLLVKPFVHPTKRRSNPALFINARNLFDQIPHRHNPTWHPQRPISDPYSLTAALRACADLRLGQQTHAHVIKSSPTSHPPVAAALLTMYSKHNDLTSATHIFDSDPPGTLLWTTIIAAHTHNRDFTGALHRFQLMRALSVPMSHFTLPTVLTACAASAALLLGMQVHACAVRAGFEACSFVQSSLVNLYAKCANPGSARRVLYCSSSDHSVSWNTLIVNCSPSMHALSLFAEMHHRMMEMDEFTYPSVLSTAAASGDARLGRLVHCFVAKSGYESYTHVSNAMVDMYAKCGCFNCAGRVFDGMSERDVVSWTALLTGFTQGGAYEAALRLYSEMRADAVEMDEFVLPGVLSSCAGLAVLALGRQVHVSSCGLGLDLFVSVGNSLVTMYAKCGCEDDGRRVFDEMQGYHDAITWTALIVGYAQNGRGRDSLVLYNRMVNTGCRPDSVTFIGLLFACSHAGLVEEGLAHFESMRRVYGVVPRQEHYACMIDLLGRSGRTREAAELVERMGAEPDAAVWKALLAACRIHRDVGLAERAAEKVFELEPDNAVPYIMLANLYSAAGRWRDVGRVRGLMKSRGVSKEPGCSWVEVGGIVHVFRAEDRRHGEGVYAKVEEMMGRIRVVGYAVDTGWSLQDVAEDGKEQGLAYHSERLAVAFGLMSLPVGAAIRVYKNLRVCGDCHTAIKLVAMVYGREIVLRDSNCFHHISSEGRCSCGDYW